MTEVPESWDTVKVDADWLRAGDGLEWEEVGTYGEHVWAKKYPDGTEEHFRIMRMGGRDETGRYELILDDGPAQGERVYVEYAE